MRVHWMTSLRSRIWQKGSVCYWRPTPLACLGIPSTYLQTFTLGVGYDTIEIHIRVHTCTLSSGMFPLSALNSVHTSTVSCQVGVLVVSPCLLHRPHSMATLAVIYSVRSHNFLLCGVHLDTRHTWASCEPFLRMSDCTVWSQVGTSWMTWCWLPAEDNRCHKLPMPLFQNPGGRALKIVDRYT